MFYKEIELSKDVIVDEKYLREHLGLSQSFINKYSRQMGVFKRKPRMFFLQNVLEFLHSRAKESQRKVLREQLIQSAKKYEINKMLEEIQRKHTKTKK
ncbi:MAG: hypothetical protein HPY60_11500 [Candidatus Methanofastidiosum sp.]|nr:hypothetical protein [Methanofastidiosum sp.]